MKHFSRILVLMLSAGLLSGCLASTKYDKNTGDIRLRPVVGLGTRAGEDFVPFPEDREFRLWAISQESGNRILDNVLVSSAGSKGWIPASSPKWPYGQALKFVGYYPADLQMTCDSDCRLKMGSYSVEGRGTDILISEPSRSYNQNDSIVGLPFYHALAKVDFRAKHALNSNTSVRIEKIEVEGLCVKGGFDSSTDLKWSVSGDKTTLAVYESDGEGAEIYSAPTYLGGSWYVLPQNSNASIKVTFAFKTGGSGWLRGQEVSTPAVIKEWLPDRHYTYTLTIQEPGVEDPSDVSFVLKYTTGISSWDEQLSE